MIKQTEQKQQKKPLIILTGPTASGKTALSIELAKRTGGAIISADSMQAYKYMDIGSAKIMPDEMQGIKHYLIDEFLPDEAFNVVTLVRPYYACRKFMRQGRFRYWQAARDFISRLSYTTSIFPGRMQTASAAGSWNSWRIYTVFSIFMSS